jgi:hypothetical protein
MSTILVRSNQPPLSLLRLPRSHDTTLDYYVNVTTGCTTDSPSAGVRLEVGVC